MLGVASSAVGREVGRALLTLAKLITAVAPSPPIGTTRTSSNQRWPSHARFHGVVALAMTSSLARLNLWSLWSPSTDRRTNRLFAAAVPAEPDASCIILPSTLCEHSERLGPGALRRRLGRRGPASVGASRDA
jgi:hypothetical protein